MSLKDTFTSTGAKFFHHEEAMAKLRNGRGQPIVTHVMLTDVCNHTCAFCSVQHRAGDSLAFVDVGHYLETLKSFGLKAVILSGGGNPILYKCRKSGVDFNDVVEWIHEMGLEVGLITNGMPTRAYGVEPGRFRESWKAVRPSTLDMLTWVRISMAGLDHEENAVYVPDLDPSRTTLGFSYVLHDIYDEPADQKHGKVSTQRDLITLDPKDRKATRWGIGRINQLTEQFIHYAEQYHPRYLRLLPNCLEPEKIEERCHVLRSMAEVVNRAVGYECAFVQNKPPAAPPACYLGYVHPVLNCDGYVYPCDSCVLNDAAGHSFANPWRMCHWSAIGEYYKTPIHSLIGDPARTCPGCVFHESNKILGGVVSGTTSLTPPSEVPEHANFV